MKKFYITTPIYYVNDRPHIGHTYTTVAADVLARFHRMIGEKTFFLTGTDEHGAKIAEKAEEAGKKPQEFVNEIAAKFQFVWDELDISFDHFIRTTEKNHKRAVQNVLQFMYDKGDIYLGKYKGLYCQGCEQFKNEKDLIDGLCPDHKTKPVHLAEESYMFKISKYADELLKKIENDEIEIRPIKKKNEIVSFYKNEGLKDVAFSRKNVKWGIPIPWDKTHTTYVWADAFLNYLTGLGWEGTTPLIRGGRGVKNPSRNINNPLSPPYQGDNLEFWPPDVQLMSKDILRVHATIWPAMLLSLGLPLPKKIFVHGFFLVEGQKMSKSLGNVISPEDLIERYGVDGARYLLMSATSFGHDGDIGWKFFDEKYNADLANGLGNLVARSIALCERVQSAKIKMKNDNAKLENWEGHDFSHSVDEMWNSYKENLSNLKIDLALNLAKGQVIQFLDNYITTTKPWELIKNNDERAGAVMYNILERLRHVAWMLWPFIPETAEKIWESLGLNSTEEMKKDFEKAVKWGGLSEDINIKKSEILFPRLSRI